MKEPKRTKARDTGKVYVWMYPETTRSYAGWHLHADAVACARISETLEELERGSLQALGFAVSPVTPDVLAVPNNRRAKARSARELRVAVTADPRQFTLEERDGVLTISAGSERLQELRNSIVGIAAGKGDFAMTSSVKRSPRNQRLWFWW